MNYSDLTTLEEFANHFADHERNTRFVIVRSLGGVKHSYYAQVQILLPYFEMIAQLQIGASSRNRSGEFFREGYRSVYPQSMLSDSDIKEIYQCLRCGLFHNGKIEGSSHSVMKRGPALTLIHHKQEIPIEWNAYKKVDDQFVPLTEDSWTTIHVNPRQLLADIESHLDGYIVKLHDPKESRLREAFTKMYYKEGRIRIEYN